MILIPAAQLHTESWLKKYLLAYDLGRLEAFDMLNDKKPRGLGRGLSALMSDINASAENDSERQRPDLLVPVENVHPNAGQPRKRFDKEPLEDLAASVKEKGIIQPLIVRPIAGKVDEYEIIAGERRWRAAQMAQLHQVPVIIRHYDDAEVLEIAIIENIQRADLNPVEEALGFQQLMDKFGHTQEKLASALGKSRSHIANSIRLLQLPEPVRDFMETGQLSAGHARALITCEDPTKLAREVIRRSLSVRETEKLAKKHIEGPSSAGKTKKKAAKKDADTLALEADLSAQLQMKVAIEHRENSNTGIVTIQYTSLDQLDELCGLLANR